MGYSPAKQDVKTLVNTAETVNRGKFVSALRRVARINNIPMIATIYEKSDNIVEQRVYDTAVMIDSTGKISSVYRKSICTTL